MLHSPGSETVKGAAPDQTKSVTPPYVTNNPAYFSAHISNGKAKQTGILLATAVVYIRTHKGNFIKARALLDQGSESSFISSTLANRLHLPKLKCNTTIIGVGQSNAGRAEALVTATIASRVNHDIQYVVNAIVLPKLTNFLPSRHLQVTTWSHVRELELADPEFDQPASIELILGAEVYAQVLKPRVKKGPKGTPVAQATTLGWILSGLVNDTSSKSQSIVTLHSSMDHLDEVLQKFWEVEEPPKPCILTPAELECEEHYKSTHFNTPCGRYVVSLPFKDDCSKLGHSRYTALHAALRMEKHFKQDASLHFQYSTFIHEYLSLNHMELVENESIQLDRSYYLPHHAVIKPSSTTTKLRVVFNASQKTSTGFSLNDLLHSGRKLQNDITPILMKWRLYPYVFAGDVEKMYRQILVNKDDCDFQRILWRDNQDESFRCYRLKTVTYGTACAPYLACRTLLQLAEDYESKYPHGAKILREHFYVDDALFGSYDKVSAIHDRDEVLALLRIAGFNLRKWLTNTPSLLDGIPEADREMNNVVKLVNDAEFKALGVGWNPSTDTCHVQFNMTDSSIATKRSILADIGRIYDPLGWLSPTIILAKILLQKLWLHKIDWDEPLTPEFTSRWQNIKRELAALHHIQIPRWIGLTSSEQSVELHGFCDASLSAYGAAIYMKVINNGQPYISLLTAKTRVSPVKTISLPRLELCGATLLAELMEFILQHVQLRQVRVHLWTDSTIVLWWLREQPSRWKVFIANRVALIHSKMPNAFWHHVRSEQNPADILTRGLSAAELTTFQLWWCGPSWLQLEDTEWPKTELGIPSFALEETRMSHIAFRQHPDPEPEMLLRYSKLTTLLHVTAYCMRFWTNARRSSNGHTSINSIRLTPSEVDQALSKWIHLVQQAHFGPEIKSLKKNEQITTSSKLRNLSPFLDHEGFIRVGGRLKNALLNYSEKFPIILPKASVITTLLIRHLHVQTLHGGVQLTLHQLRTKYWVLNSRTTVRQLIRNCVTCWKHRATTQAQIMAALPTVRVRPSKPFLNSGVDYAGPFNVTPFRRRGQRAVKSYVVLFVCMVTRAIHLELAHDLSTEAFVAVFRRFISRRGRCEKLYSDNATNFVGAEKQLALHFKNICSSPEVAHMLLSDKTEWHFIPPAAPHFGGIWEAGVKSCKHHMKRIIRDHILSIDELTTLLTQIEACLNSRPMHALSDDPEDLLPLTPGHFLLGEAPIAVPGPELRKNPINRLNRWEAVQSMLQHFWRRWSKEYITSLQLRTKWHCQRRNIQVNDLVLIKEENLPPSKWRLGRVIDLHPGDDGIVRVTTIKYAGGIYKRPITKLAVMPISSTVQNA